MFHMTWRCFYQPPYHISISTSMTLNALLPLTSILNMGNKSNFVNKYFLLVTSKESVKPSRALQLRTTNGKVVNVEVFVPLFIIIVTYVYLPYLLLLTTLLEMYWSERHLPTNATAVYSRSIEKLSLPIWVPRRSLWQICRPIWYMPTLQCSTRIIIYTTTLQVKRNLFVTLSHVLQYLHICKRQYWSVEKPLGPCQLKPTEISSSTNAPWPQKVWWTFLLRTSFTFTSEI